MSYSPKELALLAAIHFEPGENGPRLAYADWLEGNGQEEFAEFIRFRVRFDDVENDEELTLEEKVGYLSMLFHHERYQYLESICREWTGPLPPFADALSWERGLFKVEFPKAIDPAEASAAIKSYSPRLRYTIHLTPTTPEGMLDLIGTRRIQEVRLHPSRVGPQPHIRDRYSANLIPLMRTLFASPHAAALECVSVPLANGVTEEARKAWRELAPPGLKTPWWR